MNTAEILNIVLILISCLTVLLSIGLLFIITINHRQCFNFPTLLVGNTVVAVLIYGSSSLAVSSYLLHWNIHSVGSVDKLCPLRAYFQHASIAVVHHSLILQALEKYFKIKKIAIFDTKWRQAALLITQLALDYSVFMILFLTHNFPKLYVANLCFVSLTKIYLVVGFATYTYYLTDIVITIIYRYLVRFVKYASTTAHGSQSHNMHRHLTMVRRIVILNGQMAIVGLPSAVIIIIAIARTDLMSQELFIVAYIAVIIQLCVMLVLLTWMTPKLRQCVLEIFNKTHRQVIRTTTRVGPIAQRARD